MAFLSWHERYRLGHGDIDQQHLQLFERVNHFDDLIQMGLDQELGPVLDDIIGLAEAHFTFEVNLLMEVGYPRADEHKGIHTDLLRQVQAMRARMRSGGHASHKAVVRFLADWLTNHILREDLEYRPYLPGGPAAP